MAQIMGLGPKVLPGRAPSKLSAAKTEVRPTESAAKGKAQEIYIGFPKNDYAPRAGRKGRVIRDDPAKYPDREDMGFLKGVVGGWAGGETALWQFREEIKGQLSNAPQTAPTTGPKSPIRQPPKSKYPSVKPVSSAGKDEIYVGFSKDELDLKKSGVQGRVIYDEAYKYPDKEDLGPLRGVVGGFAGGEAALKAYAETGELKLRRPGEPGVRKQFSPLTLAFLIIFAAAGGGALLTTLTGLGEGGVKEIAQAPIDDTTRNLLLVALGLLGSSVAIGGARAALVSLQQRLAAGAEGAKRIVITGAFLLAVFLAASAIVSQP